MQISARNMLKGRVKQVTPGAVNTEVTIELPGGTEIVSIITKSSAERLQVSQGNRGVRDYQIERRDARDGVTALEGHPR